MATLTAIITILTCAHSESPTTSLRPSSPLTSRTISSSNYAQNATLAPSAPSTKSHPNFPKKKHTNPPKYRTIEHLSFPEGSSVNDGIDPDEFRITYQGADYLESLMRQIGPSTVFWKADIADAFRTIPVRRQDWSMQGIYWQGLFFLDMFLPFGLHSAPFIFTSLMDLFLWICIDKYNLPNLRHFVDDFIYAAHSNNMAWRSFQMFKLTATHFGVPLKPSKFIEPTTTIEYVGLQFDAPNMTISLPEDKKSRLLTIIDDRTGPPQPKPRSRQQA